MRGVHGQGRPRFTRAGTAYKSASDRAWERRVRDAYLAAGGGMHPGAVAVEVDVHGRLPLNRPKSQDRECHVFRPDADNVAKGVLDALSGAAYADDRQVTYLRVAKLDRTREDWPHVVVRVSGIGGAA